ncbi:hypothetical protein DL96DRAFT_1617619 [Flagelloscypha sp. PMI_526]|nr:hypothetical protein DL96DRAFT_1617619 [Flagelloscypha sp. PMI_526]
MTSRDSFRRVVTCNACQRSVFCTVPQDDQATLLHELREQARPDAPRRVHIKESIRAYATQLNNIERERKLLALSLHELDTAKSQLEKTISCQNGLLSPVRTLPLELLREVFDYLVCRNTISNRVAIRCDLQALRLSHVCHHWSVCARDFPSLWSNIFIALGEGARDRSGRTHLLDLYLRLSRRHPLTIRIFSTEDNYSALPKNSRYTDADIHLIYRLLNECHRWEDLEICPLHFDAFSPKLHGTLTSLRRIQFPIVEDYSVSTSGTWLASSPQLCSLESENFGSLRDAPLSKLRIADLRFYSLQLSELCFLASLPNLSSLELEVLYDEPPLPDSDSYVFSQLQRLRIGDVESDDSLYTIFKITTMPCLTELDLTGGVLIEEHPSQNQFLSFLTRSGVHLKTLKWKGTHPTFSELLAIFPYLSNLETLSLWQYARDEGFYGPSLWEALSGLTELPSGRAYRFTHLPSLQSLHIKGGLIGKDCFHSFFAMVQNRMEQYFLKKAILCSWDVPMDWLPLPLLESLRARGVDVSVHSTSWDEQGNHALTGSGRQVWPIKKE